MFVIQHWCSLYTDCTAQRCTSEAINLFLVVFFIAKLQDVGCFGPFFFIWAHKTLDITNTCINIRNLHRKFHIYRNSNETVILKSCSRPIQKFTSNKINNNNNEKQINQTGKKYDETNSITYRVRVCVCVYIWKHFKDLLHKGRFFPYDENVPAWIF